MVYVHNGDWWWGGVDMCVCLYVCDMFDGFSDPVKQKEYWDADFRGNKLEQQEVLRNINFNIL